MNKLFKKTFKDNFKQKWFKHNVFALVLTFVVVSCLSIAYSALDQEIDIIGDIAVRAEKDIRVENITSNIIDCGYDQYNPKYTVDRITVNLSLPTLDCSIEYTVTIKNNGTKNMELIDIIDENYTNRDIVYTIDGYEIGDVINANNSLTFTITFKYHSRLTSLPNSTSLGATIKFVWQEAIEDSATNFAYTGSCQQYIVTHTGQYKLEVWGAQGGDGEISATVPGGYGGYSVGIIYLEQNQLLNVCVGGQGLSSNGTTNLAGGFNGGGTAIGTNNSYYHGSGGGATDIRIGGTSLNHRVIVAGGGGGTPGMPNNQGSAGAAGGGTNGIDSTGIGGYGGTQTAGGATRCDKTCGVSGSFGSGGNSGAAHNNGFSAGAGGGGWYGGGGGGNTGGGGGGSGYVFTATSFKPSGFLLTSDYYLTGASTYAGNQTFTSPIIGKLETGHTGNGYAKITYIP